jgi:hypothetical protein
MDGRTREWRTFCTGGWRRALLTALSTRVVYVPPDTVPPVFMHG